MSVNLEPGRRYTQTSVSQLKNFRGCPRRWAFKSIAKYPFEAGDALKDGIVFHGEAEHYLTDGTLPDTSTKHGRWLANGLHLLPEPGTVDVERKFSFWLDGAGDGELDERGLLIEPVRVIGYIDFEDEEHFGDHKTTSGSRGKWAPLDAPALAEDWQAQIYAHARMQRLAKGADTAKWVYYHKRAPRAWTVHASFERETISDFVTHEVTPVVRLMNTLRKTFDKYSDLNQIPSNLAECDGVGRFCDFVEHCDLGNPGLVPVERIVEMASGRLARFREQQQKQVNVNPPEASQALEVTAEEVEGEVEVEVTAPAPPEEKTKAKTKRKPKAKAAAEGDEMTLQLESGEKLTITLTVERKK